jgi:hypothetical protein
MLKSHKYKLFESMGEAKRSLSLTWPVVILAFPVATAIYIAAMLVIVVLAVIIGLTGAGENFPYNLPQVSPGLLIAGFLLLGVISTIFFNVIYSVWFAMVWPATLSAMYGHTAKVSGVISHAFRRVLGIGLIVTIYSWMGASPLFVALIISLGTITDMYQASNIFILFGAILTLLTMPLVYLNFSLAPYAYLFEHNQTILGSLKRSRELCSNRSAQWFLVKLLLFFILVTIPALIVTSNNSGGAAESVMGLLYTGAVCFLSLVPVGLYRHLTSRQVASKYL